MTRPNPIIVGVVVLSAMVLGSEMYAIYRWRHRARPAPIEEPEREPPANRLPEPAVVAPPTPAPSPPPPSGSIPADDPLAPEGAGAIAETAIAIPRRPLFVAPDAEEVLREADEQAFESLTMPESIRETIRRLNEDHAAKLRVLRSGDPGNLSPGPQIEAPLTTPGTNQTRRAALDELLGVDTARRFDAAEHAATKRLHNRYRWQSLHGVPPGTPPSDSSAGQH